ncbi:MAG: alpha-amylase family protein [Pirellulales bacterium]
MLILLWRAARELATRVFAWCGLICLALLGSTSSGQETKSDIWDSPVLAQPFESQAFRPIRIPAWVETTAGVGYTLSVQTSEQRQRAVEAGVTISEVGFVDPLFVYYESRLLKRRNPHVATDAVERQIEEYRKLGVRILGVYPPTLQGEVYAEHPDWRRIAENTTTIPQVDLEKYPHGGMLCLLGPYGDFMIEVLAEIAERYPVDAFSFDGLHYAGVCYCQHCRENYRRETGQEIPAVNMDDPAFRRYQHWADRRMEDCIRRMQERLKGINPQLALITWTTNAGRFGHWLDIPRNMPARMNLLLDAPDQEFWLDETNRGNSIAPALSNAYIWACTNHRVAFSEPYLMSHGNPYGKDSFPGHEVQRRVLMTITHGAAPSLAVIQPGPLQQGAYDALREIQRRREWMFHKRPEPWGALLMSDNTRVFYGRQAGQVEDRYLSHVLGAFRCVLEEHLPVTVCCDWNLTPQELAPYKVLVLPNAASLDKHQLEAIREYVRAGGGLVATLDTSLCNEFGDPRSDLALRDLFGVSSAESASEPAGGDDVNRQSLDENFARQLPADYWEKRKNAFLLQLNADSPLRSAKLDALVGQEPVTFKGPANKVVAVASDSSPGGTVQATFRPHNEPSAEWGPAIVTQQYGQGRVVYFAAGLDHGLYSYAYPYQRLLLGNAVRWAASAPPPVEITAPLCVQATLFRQQLPTEAGDKQPQTRWLVHLFNNVNTTAFHASARDDVPLREETLPILDIELKVSGLPIRRATQQPEGRDLPLQPLDNGLWQITVPRLDVHSVIVLE